MTETNNTQTDNLEQELYMVQSELGVPETVARIRFILEEKQFPVYAEFDHARAAEEFGDALRPTVSVAFGVPARRVRALKREQRFAVYLPLRFAVWQDEQGRVWVGFPRMDSLAARFPQASLEEAVFMEHMMENIANRACHPASGNPGVEF